MALSEIKVSIKKQNWDVVVLTTNYPSQQNLYSGAFIKARVLGYLEKGIKVAVIVLEKKYGFMDQRAYISDGETVVDIQEQRIFDLLRQVNSKRFFAHGLPSSIIKNMLDNGFASNVVFWFHGFEVRDPMRLKYNFLGLEDKHKNPARLNLLIAVDSFVENRELYRKLLNSKLIKKIFVSEYLRNIASQDLGVEIRGSQIIPNPIDTKFFQCDKPRNRKKVLFLRPFSALNYGCDLMQQVIVEYNQQYPDNSLQFTICGDGVEHTRYTDPIAGFVNVTINKSFFNRDQVLSLYQSHGSMLVPTRFDTHGITVAEAMSAGLIVITNAVAAIPEFVDSNSAILCDSESVEQMVSNLRDLELNCQSSRYDSMSAAARQRVMAQAESEMIITKELKTVSL